MGRDLEEIGHDQMGELFENIPGDSEKFHDDQ
jgi:hypothetical protein